MTNRRRIKKTITWTKGDGPSFGHRNPSGVNPHGGDCEFKVEKYKRFYALIDCREADDGNGRRNHWLGSWLIGCATKAECRRAAEVLLAEGFEAMYRECNPSMAELYDRMEADGDPRKYGWDEHNPAKKSA